MSSNLTCRHSRAWQFHFDGPLVAHSPKWCPQCGSICHSVGTDKRTSTGEVVFQMRWTSPSWLNVNQPESATRKKIGGGT